MDLTKRSYSQLRSSVLTNGEGACVLGSMAEELVKEVIEENDQPRTPRVDDFQLSVSRKLDEINRLCSRIDDWVTAVGQQPVLVSMHGKSFRSPPCSPSFSPRKEYTSENSPRGHDGVSKLGSSKLRLPLEAPQPSAARTPMEEPQMLPKVDAKPQLKSQGSVASALFEVLTKNNTETLVQNLRRQATVLSSGSQPLDGPMLPKARCSSNSQLSPVEGKNSDMSAILSSGERRSLRGALHLTMDGTHRTDPIASTFCTIMPLMIFDSLVVVYIQSMMTWPTTSEILRSIDLVFNVIFFVEVIIRLVIYPNKRRLISKKMSSSQVFLLMDLAAAIPFGFFAYLNILKPDEEDKDDVFQAGRFLLYCAVPMLRLLKMLRYMVNLHLLLHAFHLLGEAIPSILFVMTFIIVSGASLLVLFEPPSNLHSLSHAMWLVVVTMTTVGYGDVSPITTCGYIVCSAMVVLSVLYMAIPLGIIGNIFTSVWADRDRILLMKTTRNRLAEWGYCATDIPSLFETFDQSGRGELDIFRFHDMMANMNLGFDEKRIDSMFMQFDHDGSGKIDASKFLRHLFPKTFHELFGKQSLRKLTQSMTTSTIGSNEPLNGKKGPSETRETLNRDLSRGWTTTSSGLRPLGAPYDLSGAP